MPTIQDPELRKLQGIHYTPKNLCDFIASKILENCNFIPSEKEIKIFDPAVGDGALLLSLLKALNLKGQKKIEVSGFDTDTLAIEIAKDQIKEHFDCDIDLRTGDFLEYLNENYSIKDGLFRATQTSSQYDLVISNPPYVRVQNLGSLRAQKIANDFDLKGRVDLYYPFICGIAQILRPGGVAGVIVSNRFMTTKSGASVRRRILDDFHVLHVLDLGDTKFFEAAVLPAILILQKKQANEKTVGAKFTKIYSTQDSLNVKESKSIIDALEMSGCVRVNGGQSYYISHGNLHRQSGHDEGFWRMEQAKSNGFLSTIQKHTYCDFGDIGKIRVGVKTTADEVFIRNDWHKLFRNDVPELLRPLITHHIANRFRAIELHKFSILYTHEVRNNLRGSVKIENYPNSYKYLKRHRERLEGRKYVIEAGRNWFEIWVPQDPNAWKKNKVIFRDISEKPTFWMDLEGNIVNGDCYWFTNDKNLGDDLLWLAMSVANSTFIEFYYDQMFHNKLYSNKRRFMSQYVEKFPVPTPQTNVAKQMVDLSKEIFDGLKENNMVLLQEKLDCLVWKSFGLKREEIFREGYL